MMRFHVRIDHNDGRFHIARKHRRNRRARHAQFRKTAFAENQKIIEYQIDQNRRNAGKHRQTRFPHFSQGAGVNLRHAEGQQSPEHQQRLQRPPVGLREPVGLGLPDHPAAAAAEPAALLSGPEPKPAPEILRLRQHSALPAGLYGVLRFGDAGAFRPVIFFFGILTHSPPGMIKQSNSNNLLPFIVTPFAVFVKQLIQKAQFFNILATIFPPYRCKKAPEGKTFRGVCVQLLRTGASCRWPRRNRWRG